MTKGEIISMLALVFARRAGDTGEWPKYVHYAEDAYAVLKDAGVLVEPKP